MKFESTSGGVGIFTFLFILVMSRLGLSIAILTIASVVLHELAHIAAARYFGVKVKGMGICLHGMYTRRDFAGAPLQESLIAAAGPLMNLALATLLTGWIAKANLVLALFNMLPFKGFDGHRVITACRSAVAKLETSHTSLSSSESGVRPLE